MATFLENEIYTTKEHKTGPTAHALIMLPLKDKKCRLLSSPVPKLSFLPAQYRGSTRAGERRVQDNLHAGAQNDAIFSPQIGGKTIFGNSFQIWLVAWFSEWQHTNNNFSIQID